MDYMTIITRYNLIAIVCAIPPLTVLALSVNMAYTVINFPGLDRLIGVC